jgi:hypothetical protein
MRLLIKPAIQNKKKPARKRLGGKGYRFLAGIQFIDYFQLLIEHHNACQLFINLHPWLYDTQNNHSQPSHFRHHR